MEGSSTCYTGLVLLERGRDAASDDAPTARKPDAKESRVPGLTFLPEYERHLTLAALGQCPRKYAYLLECRRGARPEPRPGDALALGIIVHLGLGHLYADLGQHLSWDSAALVRANEYMEGEAAAACRRDDIAGCLAQAKSAVAQYADHWGPMRAGWEVLAVNPAEALELPAWTLLHGWFLAYPDLVIHTAGKVIVLDHKTGKYAFKPGDWEHDPQLLTQALAARQLLPGAAVYYGIDYMQKPGARTTVWSFPATPVWEFTPEKEAEAEEWLLLGEKRLDFYRDWWPGDQAQCAAGKYGMCEWAGQCFGIEGEEE